MKNYHLHVEYRHLHQHAPPGLYVLPSFTDIRTWYGVVFLRSGAFRDAIFKFRLDIPHTYPENDARPSVVFSSTVFHPLVDPVTGVLDLSARFPSWTAGKDYIIHVLLYIKKIFYVKDFASFAAVNAEAHALAAQDAALPRGGLPAKSPTPPADTAEESGGAATAAATAAPTSEWRRRTRSCVEKSITDRYSSEPGSSIVFTVPSAKHEKLRSALHAVAEEGNGVSLRVRAAPLFCCSRPWRRRTVAATSQSRPHFNTLTIAHTPARTLHTRARPAAVAALSQRVREPTADYDVNAEVHPAV